MALIGFQEMDPIGNLLGLQQELERFLHNPAFSLGPSGYGEFPPVNVFEGKDSTLIIAETPGMEFANLKVSGQAHTLTLSGERTREEPSNSRGYHRRERRFGRFSRSIQLPQGLDLSKAEASYQAGVLMVRIPKAESAMPRQISIKTA